MIGTHIWDFGMGKGECSNGSNETGGGERGQVRGNLWIDGFMEQVEIYGAGGFMTYKLATRGKGGMYNF